MRHAALLALFTASAFADSASNVAFRLFQADARSHQAESERGSPDAPYLALALRSSAPTIKTVIRDECRRRKCAKSQCRHAQMSGYIDRAVERAANEKR